MLGTIVNTITIVIGATFGATVRQGIGEKYKKTLFDALGLPGPGNECLTA